MSEEVKDTVNENENVVIEDSGSEGYPEVKPSFYLKFMARLALVSNGVLIFSIVFLKATQIVGFDTTKLLLLEVCLFILFLALICIAVVLTTMRHKCTIHRIFALLVYISGLLGILLVMLLWAFFKAGTIV